MLRFKVSGMVALIISFPIILHQGWRFVRPAISKENRMFSRLSLIASIFLFYGGLFSTFFLLVPMAVTVLIGFVAKGILSTIGATNYISFVFLFCFLMGILYEFPILVMILTRIGIITPTFLSSKRKYAVVIIIITAALVNPTPDVVTQIILAIPLYLLFEISIIISKFTAVRKRKKQYEE